MRWNTVKCFATFAISGMKVIVLEARDRPGGRAYAALMPGTDINVDLGASWIHGPDNNPGTEVATL